MVKINLQGEYISFSSEKEATKKYK